MTLAQADAREPAPQGRGEVVGDEPDERDDRYHREEILGDFDPEMAVREV